MLYGRNSPTPPAGYPRYRSPYHSHHRPDKSPEKQEEVTERGGKPPLSPAPLAYPAVRSVDFTAGLFLVLAVIGPAAAAG